MNVVGRVGSLISQGVYSVATPFHPFGGAVDVIAVEQQDGTYRSTPWYVRFGKFQGVLKGAEKIVRISVNGVEASFHMLLDNSGEAYFVREVVSGKDNEAEGVLKEPDTPESTREDYKDKDDSNGNGVSLCRNEISISNTEEVRFSDGGVSLTTEQTEREETDIERQLFEFQDEQSPRRDSVGSSGYGAYCYDSLDHVEDMVESQGSDSEVVLVSVDGHVLTAPISSSEGDTDNVQLDTPQFHLGPGEGADFSGGNEEFSTGEDAWDADYLSGMDVSVPTNACEGDVATSGDYNASKYPSEVCKVTGELGNQTHKAHNMETDICVHCNSEDATGSLNKTDIFKSCLELSELTLHAGDEDSQDMDSPSMQFEVKKSTEDTEQSDFNFENRAQLPVPTSDPPCNKKSPDLSIGMEEASKNDALTIDNLDNMGSTSISDHSVNNDPLWKDEPFGLAPEGQHIQSSTERPEHEEECSKFEILVTQTRTSGEGTGSCTGMGFEISLCGNLLHAGMGLSPAAEAFDVHRISQEEFKTSAASIIKNENLIVRFKERYLSWDTAAPVVLGMAAFGIELPVEPKDAILVEQDEPPKPRVDTPGITSSPSGRRWRLWPIPFRRVKTLQHTSSNLSNEEVFVDSESGSQDPQVEMTPTSNRIESPRKKLVRTNIPTTEQIASLNLKEGQNMIAFNFSTRVLGTQKVDAHIYLWKWNARIVISDVDGTITNTVQILGLFIVFFTSRIQVFKALSCRSDVLGQFMPLVGKDWTQSGVARLFSAIKENGYQLLFLSARAIVQAYLTRSFLLNLKQDGKALPKGPVVISPDGLFPSLYREVIRRAPHEFKIACLEDIKALFPCDYNPFYAGFGNRDTDELSYRKIGIPKGKIFIINPKGEVAISHRIDVKSYTSLHTLVNDMFPPTSLVEQPFDVFFFFFFPIYKQEDFNSWNYWRVPLQNID
ncbi:hypothetical protein HHK36_010905 [Tetracentron sinense]|uniref:phosphatidate phosphatase n=1 Tax=Tetracentron sinense TaxID=13715 RepID=A0A835DK00_TETSI|nr:hypothetical protein HHK36_010905 [Tetracentron sinense]